MKFTSGDINKIRKTELAVKVELTSGSFYAKKAFDGENELEGLTLAINELIYTKIAKIIGIISPEVYVVGTNEFNENEIFIVSEDLNAVGNFKTMGELGLKRSSSSSLSEIFTFLQNKFALDATYKDELPYIYTDLMKLYFMDIFFSFWDRLPDNFGLISLDGKLALAILDNEYAFTDFIHNISSETDGNVWHQKRKKLNQVREEVKYQNCTVYEKYREELINNDLKNFYEGPYQEYARIYDNMYEVFTPQFLEEILKEIEAEEYIYFPKEKRKIVIADKDQIIKDYEKTYALLTEIKRSFNYGRK